MDIAFFFNHDVVAVLNVIHHPSSPFNAATCLSPLARGSLCIRVTYQIYGYVEPAVKEGYFELFSCSLQPGFQASYDGLVYILYGLSNVSPSERQPGRSRHSATYLPSSSFSMVILNFIFTCLFPVL